MQRTMNALNKVIPGFEEKTFSKDLAEGPRQSMVALWSLANDIDNGMKTLLEASTSLTRRFQMYTESLAEGVLSGLDSPIRSSYMLDIVELQNKLLAQRQSLLTIMSLTYGAELRRALEKELP